MKKDTSRFSSFLALFLYMTAAMAQDSKTHLFGLVGGVAFTSNPVALQKLTDNTHYVDGNGGFTYLYHNQVTDGYAFEYQMSFIGSSVNMLDHNGDETKMKFILPMDFRWFLGNPTISAYVGAGLQYNTVWIFTSEKGSNDYYYDDWWGDYYYYDDPFGNVSWDWTLNQLSTNLAVGFKIGMGEDRQHNIILGTKFHFPVINASEYHGSENNFIDLSKDKINASLTGGISLGFSKQKGAFKIDCEYPLGGNLENQVYDGVSSTFFTSHSWALSATLLFKI